MFLSAIVIFTAVGTILSVTYKKGGVALLSPGSVYSPISSVTWKHGPDIAVEWDGEETIVYRDFRGRSELNTKTGQLRISNLSLKDSGSYTAEINNRIMRTTDITVLTAVPKPTISTLCNPEETQCTLTCEASITDDMGTVRYSWESGDRKINESPNWLHISKDDPESIGKLISCQLYNLVSRERSDDIMILNAAVPKPTISTQCNPEKPQCTLTCEANITDDMGPVRYSWETGGRKINESTSKQLHISKDHTELVGKPISCQLENPVSRERSDDIISPFRSGSSGGLNKAAVIVLQILLIAMVMGSAVCCLQKCRQKYASWSRYFALRRFRNPGRKQQQTPEQTQLNQKAEIKILIGGAETSAVAPNTEETLKQQEDETAEDSA